MTANSIDIVINDGPTDTEYFVSLVGSGFTFFRVSIVKPIVDKWAESGELAGRMMEIFVDAHPATNIVNDLIPLLDTLTSVSNPEAVDAFRERTLATLELLGRRPLDS